MTTHRDDQFYREAFLLPSTWDFTTFYDQCRAHGVSVSESFTETAERLWDALSESEKAEFKSDYDDWMND